MNKEEYYDLVFNKGRKQGALEEFVKIKQMYYRLDTNRFMEFLNQEKLDFEKELEEGVEK